MVKARLEKGSVIDGFRIEELVTRGGMAALWRVTHPDHAQPLIMKVPRLAEGESPSAIVAFEMEMMILPRVSGPHVPRFIAAGDFATQPYIVMEEIPGRSLLTRLKDLPLPYAEVAEIGARIATALDDLHRQHVEHLDVKPSNIMFRPTGEAVLLDFGLARHDHLPDLMHEEFHLPFGTAPYMAPEQLLGVRHDPRSDIFALGVLLYFFSTGLRPHGESERMRGMKKRLWRDPFPPRALKPNYPPWLQEIVLRCLEVQPPWRYPTAAQLAFDLTHPDQVKLTQRSERLKRDPWTTRVRRRFNSDLTRAPAKTAMAVQIASAPIVLVAVDLREEARAINQSLLAMTRRILETVPDARLACLNILKQGRLSIDTTLDEHGHNKHIDRMVGVRHWAEPLKLEESRLTVHVIEATDPADAILDYAKVNNVDHILLGARADSFMRTLLGSVSAKVAAEAMCSVTVVRPPRLTAAPQPAGAAPVESEREPA